MKQFDGARTPRIKSRLAMLIALCVAALGLGLLPSSIAQPLRNGWREGLRPALQFWAAATDWTGHRWTDLQPGGDLQQAEATIAQLKEQLRRLETRLELTTLNLASDQHSALEEQALSKPLLVPQAVHARVLGRQAQTFLQSRELIDVGKSNGVVALSWVVDDVPADAGPPMVDQGRDGAIMPGRLVLAGTRVWGKVAQVGPHTSTIQRISDVGYRDLVRLVSRRDGQWRLAARGVLVGRGEPLCKIELVETTEAITVGDLVLTADDGVLETPLVYGRVARLERKPGQGHWQIWMEPAVAASSPPTHVAVLRMDLNPARLAGP